jgi:hypothetical protein
MRRAPIDGLHVRATDFANDQDRAWFRGNPGEDYYVREGFEHEWCWAAPNGECLPILGPSPPGATLVVDVWNLGPGLRVRGPRYGVLVR